MIREVLNNWLRKRGCDFVGGRWCGDYYNVSIGDDNIEIWDVSLRRYVRTIQFADPDLFNQLEVWFK